MGFWYFNACWPNVGWSTVIEKKKKKKMGYRLVISCVRDCGCVRHNRCLYLTSSKALSRIRVAASPWDAATIRVEIILQRAATVRKIGFFFVLNVFKMIPRWFDCSASLAGWLVSILSVTLIHFAARLLRSNTPWWFPWFIQTHTHTQYQLRASRMLNK